MSQVKGQAVWRDLLTIGEAATLLGVHPDTLRNWDRSGKLPARRHPINGYRLYSRARLEQLSATDMPKKTSLGVR